MFILYKALVATSRISFNVSQGSFKALSSQLTFLRAKAFHRISCDVVRSSPKWHILVTTPVGIFLCNHLRPGVVQCKTRSSVSQQLLLRKAQRNVSKGNAVKFNWARLVELMLPDILLLAGAVVVSSKGNDVLIFCIVFRVLLLLLLSIFEYHFCLVTWSMWYHN